eukprot:4911797-Alexandrium_andersonii.AAC.1
MSRAGASGAGLASAPPRSSGPPSSATTSPGTRPPSGPPSSGSTPRWSSSGKASASPPEKTVQEVLGELSWFAREGRVALRRGRSLSGKLSSMAGL